MTVKELRSYVDEKKGERTAIKRQIKEYREEILNLTRDLRRHQDAFAIVKEVGIKTQQQLQFKISDIASVALEAVFTDPYELQVNFVERRNVSECDIVFVKNENEVDPLSAAGGGVVDIAAFALRIASYTMQTPQSRKVIIMDEPFRFVSIEYQEKASMMLKEISKRLGIQFIIVTHNEILTTFADKIFTVTNRKGISKIIGL